MSATYGGVALHIEKRRAESRRKAELLAQYAGKYSTEEIAELMGLTKRAVQKLAEVHKISLKYKVRYWTDEEKKFIRKNAPLMTITEVAEKLGRTRPSVFNYASQNGIRFIKRGESHWRVTVSDEDVELCRQLHDAGLTIREIAEKMEIPATSVSGYTGYLTRI